MSADEYPPLNLPPAKLKLRMQPECNRPQVYDPQRRRWVALTPEEWVRQHFVAMLINEKGYFAGSIANEIGISLNSTSRRCDTVVFDNRKEPYIIVEYKAPSVEITQDVFDQITRYNMVLQAPLLIVSNGLHHYCCAIDYAGRSYRFLPEIPAFGDIIP